VHGGNTEWSQRRSWRTMTAQDLQDRARDDQATSVGERVGSLDDTTPLPPVPSGTEGRRRPASRAAVALTARPWRWVEASVLGPIAESRVGSWLSAHLGPLRKAHRWTWIAAGVLALVVAVLLLTLPGHGSRSRSSSSTSPLPPPSVTVPERPVPSSAPPAPPSSAPTATAPHASRPLAPAQLPATAASSSAPPSTQACSNGGPRHGHHQTPCAADGSPQHHGHGH
jgi:hypothetical protein